MQPTLSTVVPSHAGAGGAGSTVAAPAAGRQSAAGAVFAGLLPHDAMPATQPLAAPAGLALSDPAMRDRLSAALADLEDAVQAGLADLPPTAGQDEVLGVAGLALAQFRETVQAVSDESGVDLGGVMRTNLAASEARLAGLLDTAGTSAPMAVSGDAVRDVAKVAAGLLGHAAAPFAVPPGPVRDLFDRMLAQPPRRAGAVQAVAGAPHAGAEAMGPTQGAGTAGQMPAPATTEAQQAPGSVAHDPDGRGASALTAPSSEAAPRLPSDSARAASGKGAEPPAVAARAESQPALAPNPQPRVAAPQSTPDPSATPAPATLGPATLGLTVPGTGADRVSPALTAPRLGAVRGAGTEGRPGDPAAQAPAAKAPDTEDAVEPDRSPATRAKVREAIVAALRDAVQAQSHGPGPGATSVAQSQPLPTAMPPVPTHPGAASPPAGPPSDQAVPNQSAPDQPASGQAGAAGSETQLRRASLAGQTLRVDLGHAELGDVEIDLAPGDGGKLRIVLRAENPAMLAALRQDRDGLATLLQSSGMAPSGGEVGYESMGQGRRGAPDQGRAVSPATPPDALSEAPLAPQIPAAHRPLPGPGRLDILT
ncbi:flagellar hook-length control protein FliK [Mesobaculum littorinae]|uniref:Flagellar hook-length control protein FliK n=1 Tax=Mesobaculum littorinae TaxID=2486419 RepID=A0A438ADS7_9RHOB|nr:flagellar hook-length control protein FliK [Mesobaculum littorinae]RVV96856.1 flagellar hook-length control protein FliK [Mesobaculum littorinae]